MSAQNVFVKEIRARIDTYFRIVLRNVRDTVPKTVGYFLVKMSQEKLQFELYTRINASPQIADALGEPKNITERRVTLSTIIKTLSDSLRVLQRDPDITAASIDDGELAEELRKDAMQRKAAGGAPGQQPQQMNRPPGQGMPPPN